MLSGNFAAIVFTLFMYTYARMTFQRECHHMDCIALGKQTAQAKNIFFDPRNHAFNLLTQSYQEPMSGVVHIILDVSYYYANSLCSKNVTIVLKEHHYYAPMQLTQK